MREIPGTVTDRGALRRALAEAEGKTLAEDVAEQLAPGFDTEARYSDVIVKGTTLSSVGEIAYRDVHETVKRLAVNHGWTNREAAAVIAQSYGLRVHFS